jgi:hypothetical protein
MPVLTIGIGLAIGIAWLIGCCVLIGKMREKERKTPMIVIAVILFILSAVGFIGTQVGAAVGTKALDAGGELLYEYLVENHSNVQVVRRGVDIPDVPQAMDDLEGIVPRKISEFGLSGPLLQSLYQKSLSRGFDILRSKTDLIISFANKDGKVTSATIIAALVWEINRIVRRIVFISAAVAAVILAIYICICAFLALKKPQEPKVMQG